MAASLRQGAVQPSELPMIGIVRHETSRLHMAWFPARAVLILGKEAGEPGVSQPSHGTKLQHQGEVREARVQWVVP